MNEQGEPTLIGGCGRARVGSTGWSLRNRSRTWRWMTLATLLLAPAALAADLQITDLSDTGYDPTPAGGEVVYNVTVEVYVDGRLTSTTTQRVTKLGGNQGFTRTDIALH